MHAANRIDHEIHAASICELLQNGKPVLLPIIDRMVQATLGKKLVLTRARSAISFGADLLRDVERRESNSATGIVNQNRFAKM